MRHAQADLSTYALGLSTTSLLTNHAHRLWMLSLPPRVNMIFRARRSSLARIVTDDLWHRSW